MVTAVPVNQSDESWMARALVLASFGATTTSPNPRVGCVIVRDGVNVGEGYHQRAGTGHAEVHALAAAGDQAPGATAYVTLEPCSHYGRTPPCADALIAAGISRVVCAMQDPNPQVAGTGLARLAAAGIDICLGVLSQDAERMNRGFLQRMRTGKPWLTLKLACSLDGATAMGSGESQWITGTEARADVQRARSQSCAILSGIGTVLSDDPSLNVRLDGCDRQPDRVILDTQLNTPTSARLLTLPGKTWLLHSSAASAQRVSALTAAGAKLVLMPHKEDGWLDLAAVSVWLGQQQFNEVWAEPGARLAGALLQAGQVDEVWLYQAPVLLGADTRPLIATKMASLAQRLELTLLDVRSVGQDLRLQLRPQVRSL